HGDAAKSRAQRPEIDVAMIAVARAGATEAGEVAIATGVHEGPGVHGMGAAVIMEGDGGETVVLPLCASDKAVKGDVDTGFDADFVERPLGRLGIDHDEYAAVPLRRTDAA